MFQSYLNYCIFLFFVTVANSLMAQDSLNLNANKKMPAFKITNPPKIDGSLDDAVWANAPTVDDFTTFEPEVGVAPSQRTQVKVVYDNDAIYIGAYMYDTNAAEIYQQLGLRDTWNINADYFGVFLDTYDDDQNGFGFIVTASNVQNDAKYSTTEGRREDESWDAVWFSKARIVADGWIAEIKIPYAAIRFPKKELQNWGIGFMRQIRRDRERMMWNIMDPTVEGFVNQLGTLEKLEGITPPLRLSITPYASLYYERYSDTENPQDTYDYWVPRGGLDLKYGINESFTLDMILIPDFGQVQSDDQILNLQPFEVRFNERRPFFIEGTELFSKGNLFYSRRVGGRPVDYYGASNDLLTDEEVIRNPSETPLLNAAKVSGRTKGNLGIGVFNAVTNATNALIRNAEGEEREYMTNPLTNYNIVVFDQALKNRSFVSLINTNVMRAGSFTDANVTGLSFRFADKKNKYAVKGTGSLSQRFNKDFENGVDRGFKYAAEVAKVSGNFQAALWHNTESDTYNPNDLGFLSNPNEFSNGLVLRYNRYKPFGPFNSFFSNMRFTHEMLYAPRAFTNFSMNVVAGVNTKKFLSLGLWLFTRPVEGRDYFGPRTGDLSRYFITSPWLSYGGWLSSDYSKPFAIDINWGIGRGFLYDNKYYEFSLSPRWRVNDRLMFIINSAYNYGPDMINYAIGQDSDDDDIIYGRYQLDEVNNILEANYLFTSRMALNLRFRHYWSRVLYYDYYTLQEDGYIGETDYDEAHNLAYNAITINAGYTWQFSPGSELSLVWQNQIYKSNGSGDDLEVYNNIAQNSYFTNFAETIIAPQTNTVSLKLLYYFDYQMASKLLKRKKDKK